METELKLRIDPKHIKKFMQHSLLRTAAGNLEPQHLYNTYFDTPEHSLLQQGIGLRVRRIEEKRWQTVKTAGSGLGGLHQRQEWETEITGDTPDYQRLPAGPLAQWCANQHNLQRLQPLFTTDFTRTLWNVIIDGSQIEVVLDQGEIRTATAKLPLSEVELELKSGALDRLYHLALLLQKTVPLLVENQSKAARGYRIHTPVLPTYHKAKSSVGLSPAMTTEEAFVKIIWHCLEHLQSNEEVVLHGEEIEGVHQMRVAMRRLRSGLTLYKSVIPNRTHTKIRKELKWISNVLGVARDWDIFNLTLCSIPLEYHKNLQELFAITTKQQQEAYATVREVLQDNRYSRLLLMLGKWLTRHSWRLHIAESDLPYLEQPAGEFAQRMLEQHYQLICRDGEQLPTLEPERRHRLRISIKKLAYGIRFFAELFPAAEEASRSFAKSLSLLQNELGILNDANTAMKLLNQIGIGENAPARHFLNGWYAHHEAVHLTNLKTTWQQWRDLPVFW